MHDGCLDPQHGLHWHGHQITQTHGARVVVVVSVVVVPSIVVLVVAFGSVVVVTSVVVDGVFPTAPLINKKNR